MKLNDILKNGVESIKDNTSDLSNNINNSSAQNAGLLLDKQALDMTMGMISDLNHNKDFSHFGDLSDYTDYNVVPNLIDKDLDKQRAKNQSAIEQFGASLLQGVVGEVVGGTIEGFGAIGDIITGAAFKEDNDYANDITKLGSNIREWTQETAPIYQENPEASLDFTDTGYIFSRLPSVLSSLSLLIPAGAATKVIGKGGSLLTKGLSATRKGNAIAKAAKAGKYGNTIKNLSSPYNLNKLRSYAESGITAVGMRLGENYQEARQTAEEVKDETLNYFNKISNSEYEKWASENTTLLDGIDINDKEAVADRIASKAAGRDFTFNMANLAFDYLQLRGLSSAWKNLASRPATFAARQANKMAANTIGRTTEELANLSKKSISSKLKDGAKRSLLNNYTIIAGELSEGIEESINYISSQEGLIYGRQLRGELNKSDEFIDRAKDYLRDPMLYDSALWGVIGGVVFHGLGEAAGNLKNKILKEEDITNKQRLSEINSRSLYWNEIKNKIDKINNNINPYEINTDENGEPIIVDNNISYKTIETEEEKQELKDKVDREAITSMTLNAIRNGNYELLKSYINEPTLKDRLIETGITTNEDYESYNTKINNILEDTYNKFTNYSTSLQNSDISDVYLSMAISNNIYNENTIEEINSKINNLKNNNEKLAIITPKIQELRNTINLDNRLKVGILQETIADFKREKNSIKDKSKIKELDKYIISAENILSKYKETLSPIELLKSKMQENIINKQDLSIVEKEIEDYIKENGDEEFNSIGNTFNIGYIENFSKEISKPYIDNIYDGLTYELQKTLVDNNIIRTQNEAEVFAKEQQDFNEKQAKDIEVKAKSIIKNNLNSEENYRKIYAYLTNDENIELSADIKKDLDYAKSVLETKYGKKFYEDIKNEYNKYKSEFEKLKNKEDIGKPPVEIIQDINSNKPNDVGVNNTDNINNEIKTKLKKDLIVEKPKSLETVKDEKAVNEFDKKVDNLSKSSTKILSNKEILESEFKLNRPFTYKGNTYNNLEIIPANFGQVLIIVSDDKGIEETLNATQLTYLVNSGIILSTGDRTETNENERLSNISEESLNNVKNRFNETISLIEYYIKAVNRKTINNKTQISFEDLMRFIVDRKGTSAANNLYNDIKLTLDYLSNIDNSIIISDNKSILNNSQESFINKISKPKVEEIKEDVKKDNTPSIFQAYINNKLSNKYLASKDELDRFNALMSIKNGDKLQTNITGNGTIELYNNNILIATLPSITIGDKGEYLAINEFWKYNINVVDNNIFKDEFINELKHILNNSFEDNNDVLLNALEQLRTAINSGEYINESLEYLEEVPKYKELINKYSSKLKTTEDKLKRAKHILKLFGYNNNVDITLRGSYQIINYSLDKWVDKLGSNYSNINNLKNSILENKNVIVHNVTSGKLLKSIDNNGFPIQNNIKEVIRKSDSDNYKLYYANGNGELIGEGNPNDVEITQERIRTGSAVLFTKDSNGNKIPIHTFPNSLNSSEKGKIIHDKIMNVMYNGLESLLNNNIEEFNNNISILRDYIGSGKLTYGIDIVPTNNGYVFNFSNGYSIFANTQGNISVVPYYNKKPIKNNKNQNIGYYTTSERNKITPAFSINLLKKLSNKYESALRINFNKDAILNNKIPNKILGSDNIIRNTEDGRFEITLPDGELINFKDYKSFLIDNNLLTTDVDYVRGPNKENLGNFNESGEGVYFDKNLYITLEQNNQENQIVQNEQEVQNEQGLSINYIRNNIENKNLTLVDISNLLNTEIYNPILDIFDKLDIKINKKIKPNNGNYKNTNAKYNIKTKEITLYDKWFELNSDRATRILVHEGIHAYLHNDNSTEELYNKFKDVFNTYKDFTNSIEDKELKKAYSKFINISKNENTNLEEFIVESLTNKELIQYLNNIEFNSKIEKTESKSLFRRLLDIMIDLIKTVDKINDNTLLARINNIFNEFGEKQINNQEINNQINIEESLPDIIEDDMSIFDGIDDDMSLFSSINEINQKDISSVNGLRNSLNELDKNKFDKLYNNGLMNITCH